MQYLPCLGQALISPVTLVLAYVARQEIKVIIRFCRILGVVPALTSPAVGGFFAVVAGLALLPAVPGIMKEVRLSRRSRRR